MSLKNDAFPSSAAFDQIQEYLSSDSNKKDALKAKCIFALVLKNAKGEEDSWHIDLKEKGTVGKGKGKKPTATLLLSEEDFGKLANGNVKPQKLYMTGKMKIQGNIMSTTKLEPILLKAQTMSKL